MMMDLAAKELSQAPGDAGFVEIVGGHFHANAVAGGDADPALAHLAADGGEHSMLIIEFDAEHGTGQDGANDTFNFNVLFFHRLSRPTNAATSARNDAAMSFVAIWGENNGDYGKIK